jgi:anti-sigma factor RsiW
VTADSGHVGDVLSALLDGELQGAEAEAARAHLAGCATCAAESIAVTQARSWLRSLPPVEPPAQFYVRLFADHADHADEADEADDAADTGEAHGHRQPAVTSVLVARRLRLRAGVAAMAACAAATVVVLGLVSPHDSPTTPPVTRFIEAHATAVGAGDPVSQLAPAVVPVAFRP